MKKIISILLFSITFVLFSSCVYVNPKHLPDPDDYIPLHNITFINNTDDYVTDWYVEDKNGRNYEKSEYCVPIRSRDSSTIYNLHERYYRVVFSYTRSPSYSDYYCSAYTYLDTNTKYQLNENTFTYRSQNNLNEPQFYLSDENGNKIELYKMNKE